LLRTHDTHVKKVLQEKFEDTKDVIRNHTLKRDRQHTGQKKKRQKDKQRYTKHYIER